jgi:hypothetical protein
MVDDKASEVNTFLKTIDALSSTITSVQHVVAALIPARSHARQLAPHRHAFGALSRCPSTVEPFWKIQGTH